MMTFYGVPFQTRVTAYPNGFCYGQMVPVPPESFPDRVQRAAEVFEGKLWRDQAKEWHEVRKPASVQAHHEIQAVDPDALSDEELVELPAPLPRPPRHDDQAAHGVHRHRGHPPERLPRPRSGSGPVCRR